MNVVLSRAAALRVLAAAAAAAAAPQRAFAQTAPLIRVGVESQGETFASVFYGVQAGIFTRAGLDVETSSFPTAGPIAAALAGGSIDVGTVDVILLANAVNRGVPLVAIAAGGLFRTQEPTSALCVPASSPIRTAKQLEGTTLALGTLVSLTSISLKMWLEKNGADPAKVQFVEMKFSEMPAALQRGTVTSAYITEPYLSQNAGNLRIIATPYSAIADTFPISVIVTTRSWLNANAALARKFVAACSETARWANANRAQTAMMLSKWESIDLPVVQQVHRVQFATTLDAGQMQAELDAAASNKLIDRPTNAGDLIARV